MDLTQDRKKLMELYRPGATDFSLVDVPELPFAMIDGEGSPDDGAAADVIKQLFTAIYPIRRLARERMGKAFVEAPLEMQFWADDMGDLAAGRKQNWKWRAMITLPAWLEAPAFSELVSSTGETFSPSLRMESFGEGQCAQIMFVGKSEEVPARLARLYEQYLPDNNLQPSGPYHEIYLDDWNRAAPERRKLILRQPVQPRG